MCGCCLGDVLRDGAPNSQSIRYSAGRKRREGYICKPCSGRFLGWVGLEPTTNALKGRCSTIELPTQIRKQFYAALPRLATNPERFRGCSTIELPTRSGRDTFLIQFDQCRKVAGWFNASRHGRAAPKPRSGARYGACLRRQSAVATTKLGRFGKPFRQGSRP